MGFWNLFKCKSSQEEKPKNDISDFFKIDINNIFQYNPEYKYSETSVTGNEVKHYNLRLMKLEMGIFYEIEILEVGENELNLVFKGRNNSLTEDLKSFIEFCASKFGLDNMGYGSIEESDYTNIQMNTFSRMWKHVWIDNISQDYRISMTIFGINKVNVPNN